MPSHVLKAARIFPLITEDDAQVNVRDRVRNYAVSPLSYVRRNPGLLVLTDCRTFLRDQVGDAKLAARRSL